MTPSFVAPSYRAPLFTCPHCNTKASMEWHFLSPLNVRMLADGKAPHWSAAVCAGCKEQSIWGVRSSLPAAAAYGEEHQMCWPATKVGSPLSADLPPEIEKDYEEARSVGAASPRAAAALLRLCIQRLCILLGEPGDNINADIASLVKNKDLNPRAQRAFDSVRVIGNNAVHPGQLSDAELDSAVPLLFQVVAFMVEDLITTKVIDAAYAMVPQSKKDAIAKRDAGAGSKAS